MHHRTHHGTHHRTHHGALALILTLAACGGRQSGESAAEGSSSPSSPSAREGGRSSLPLPDPEFEGRIGQTFEDSEQDYPQPVEAPEGAPNIVVILLDDLGFGQPSAFGGPVPTPKMEELAQAGLSYTRFHTTGICSPTRASLLTGRNHHQTAFGTITELSTGYPGYHSVWPKETASIARVLRDNGYRTAAWGKWHNTPDWETSPMGPSTIGPPVWASSTSMDSRAVRRANTIPSSSGTPPPSSRRSLPKRATT